MHIYCLECQMNFIQTPSFLSQLRTTIHNSIYCVIDSVWQEKNNFLSMKILFRQDPVSLSPFVLSTQTGSVF